MACHKKQQLTSAVVNAPTSVDFQKGEYFNDSTDHKDSAFFYFNKVAKNSNDSLLIGMSYAYMAMIQNQAGDYYGVQESALAGIKAVNEKNPQHAYCLSSLYNVLGRSNVGLRDYDAAITHYTLALQYQPYEGFKDATRNNIAVALREKGDYQAALSLLTSIKTPPNESKADLARRITNIASLKWKAVKYNPVNDLHHALELRLQDGNEIGITASYNHLSDYYMEINRDSALFYVNNMYRHAQITGNTDDQLDALRKLTSLSPVTETKRHFEKYQLLSDSLQTARAEAKNQFAVIRYESEKSKSENLVLQEENAEKRLQLLNERLLFGGLILLAALIVLASVWQYRKKKKEEEQKTQMAIRDNQLRFSQKIHDTVANGLYRMMSEIEHVDTIDKEKLLDRVEDLYERSRDISYEHDTSVTNADDRINQTLNSFATPSTTVSIVGNQTDLWHNVPPLIVKELEHVLQELAVNMKKHSGARHVVFHFSKVNDRLHILYKDDGSGFRPNFQKGNGLRSTENRIQQIGGQATFTTGSASGAEIKIIVPTNLK